MIRKYSIFFFLPLLLYCYILSGCDSVSKPADDGGGTKDTIYKIDYEFGVKNLRPLRNGESYALWVRKAPESEWQLASDSKFNNFPVRDSTTIYGSFTSKIDPDHIREALVTIELTKTPVSPGIALLKGTIAGRVGPMTMSHLGDFSKTTGGLTFTSPEGDTDDYKHEFYLMKPGAQPSISFLPTLNSGWRYGIWVADYEFFPYHEFLYGLFDRAAGHDSDSGTDAYEFPGGQKKQPLDVPTGRIIVTLEPPLYGDSLRYKGAELLYVLQLNRFVNIERDKFYAMSNVSGIWLPSGRITFIRRQ